MAKQKRSGGPFDAGTRERLAAVGPHELVTDPGYCEIHFGPVPALTVDWLAFEMLWYVHGPGKGIPAPADGLFELWGRYRAAHGRACVAYRRLLFDLYSRSPAPGYDDRQWGQLRRRRPTAGDLSGSERANARQTADPSVRPSEAAA